MTHPPPQGAGGVPPETNPEETSGFDPEAVRLVAGLNDLMSGEFAVTALIELGPKAIPPLRAFLLDGRPRTVYHPRRWAVAALGGLGAVEVLLDYLALSRWIGDPEVRFAEEAVQNAAVRALAPHANQRIVEFLLDLAQRQMLPSLAEVFGQWRSTAALPFLDRALEDSVCRPAAEEAFRSIGKPARAQLIGSALTPYPRTGPETPSSLRRRRSALSLLAEIGIEPKDWAELKPLAADPDPELFVHLCAVAAQAGVPDARHGLVRRLIREFPVAPWYLHESVEQSLTAWFDVAEGIIEEEVKQRTHRQQANPGFDETLRFLLRVLRAARQRRAGRIQQTEC